jgi:hypothetical protein
MVHSVSDSSSSSLCLCLYVSISGCVESDMLGANDMDSAADAQQVHSISNGQAVAAVSLAAVKPAEAEEKAPLAGQGQQRPRSSSKTEENDPNLQPVDLMEVMFKPEELKQLADNNKNQLVENGPVSLSRTPSTSDDTALLQLQNHNPVRRRPSRSASAFAELNTKAQILTPTTTPQKKDPSTSNANAINNSTPLPRKVSSDNPFTRKVNPNENPFAPSLNQNQNQASEERKGSNNSSPALKSQSADKAPDTSNPFILSSATTPKTVRLTDSISSCVLMSCLAFVFVLFFLSE